VEADREESEDAISKVLHVGLCALPVAVYQSSALTWQCSVLRVFSLLDSISNITAAFVRAEMFFHVPLILTGRLPRSRPVDRNLWQTSTIDSIRYIQAAGLHGSSLPFFVSRHFLLIHWRVCSSGNVLQKARRSMHVRLCFGLNAQSKCLLPLTITRRQATGRFHSTFLYTRPTALERCMELVLVRVVISLYSHTLSYLSLGVYVVGCWSGTIRLQVT